MRRHSSVPSGCVHREHLHTSKDTTFSKQKLHAPRDPPRSKGSPTQITAPSRSSHNLHSEPFHLRAFLCNITFPDWTWKSRLRLSRSRGLTLGVVALRTVPRLILFFKTLAMLSCLIQARGLLLEATSPILLLCPLRNHLGLCVGGSPLFEAFFQFFSRLHGICDVLFEIL